MAAAVVVVATAVETVVAMAEAEAAVAVASVADPNRFPNKKSPHMRALFCVLKAQSRTNKVTKGSGPT
jgi:hypothetical protein